MSTNTKNEQLVLVASAAIAVFVCQYFFRSFDDNRLASWAAVFPAVSASGVFALLAVAAFAAAFLPLDRIAVRHQPVFLVALSSAASVFFWGEPEMIVDSARYFGQAKHLELYGLGSFIREWGVRIGVWTDLPLAPLFYGLIFRVFGESRMYAQAFATCLFSGTVLLTYLTGRRLWDSETGFWGGLLLLGMPYLYTQVPLLLVDIPTMFGAVLALYCFLRALDDGGRWVWIASLSLAGAFLLKYSSLIMLAVLGAAVAVAVARAQAPQTAGGCTARPQEARTVAARALSVFLISAALLAAPAYGKRGVVLEQVRLLLSYQGPGLSRWGESFLSTFLFQVHPFVTAAACYSAWAAIRRKDASYLIVSMLVFLMVVFQVRRIRYLMIVFPAFALMAAYGFRSFPSRRIAGAFVSCALASSLVVSLAAYLPSFKAISYVNLERAGAYLDSLPVKEAEVYTFPSSGSEINPAVAVPLLDIYTAKEIRTRGGLSVPPPDEVRATSSLRFTWECPLPSFYEASPARGRPEAVVVVFGDADFSMPADLAVMTSGYRKSAEFTVRDDIYVYQTLVKVFHD